LAQLFFRRRVVAGNPKQRLDRQAPVNQRFSLILLSLLRIFRIVAEIARIQDRPGYLAKIVK